MARRQLRKPPAASAQTGLSTGLSVYVLAIKCEREIHKKTHI